LTRRIILYSKDPCGLCVEAKALLDALATEFDVQIEEVDITTDEALHQRFRLLIPVASIENGPLLYWPFDMEALLDGLAKAQDTD